MQELVLKGTLRGLRVLGPMTRHVPNDQVQLLSFLASPRVREDPWRIYARLHRRGGCVDTPFPVTIVASHAGVTEVLRHPATSVDESRAVGLPRLGRSSPFAELMNRTLLFLDPPDHARLRRLVSRAFTPRTVEALRPRVEAAVEEALDRLAPRGEGDLIAGLALPLPVAVICDLLGILEADRPRFLDWARHLAPRLDISLFRDDEKERLGDAAALEVAALLGELIVDPGRRDPDGLLAGLVAVEVDGERLTSDEIIALCALLLVAGFETTTNLIGNGVHALLAHPDQLARVRDGDVPAATVVDELLRFAGPVQFTQRVVLEDVEVSGHPIPAGTLVGLVLGAANRDPAVFDRPDELDVGRDPNPHVSFSTGIHHCLGAALARLEAQVAIPAVLRRLPDLQPAAPARWRDTFVLRGLTSLPLRWSAGR